MHYFTPRSSGHFPSGTDPNISDYVEAVLRRQAPPRIFPIKICSLKSLKLQKGITVGWSAEGVPDEDDSRNLNEVNLTVNKRLAGNKNFLYANTVYDSVVKTPCPGDSGGPLLFIPNKSGTKFCLLGTVADGNLEEMCYGAPGRDKVDN